MCRSLCFLAFLFGDFSGALGFGVFDKVCNDGVFMVILRCLQAFGWFVQLLF